MSNECVVYEVSGDFAHFRKPHTTSPSQTFGIPPRTTVAGITAAILGLDRDSYYDTFARDTSRIAISLEAPIRRLPLAVNLVNTEGSSAKTKGAKPGKYFRDNRQQNVFEYLCDPRYRFYISLTDDALLDELTELLENGKSVYAPSLGLSEHIAKTEFIGKYKIEQAHGTETVRSVVPGNKIPLVPEAGANYVTERVPGFMKSHDSGGRVSDGHVQFTYDRSTNGVQLRDADYTEVGGDAVVFS
jgi:CRISPR-associated protein Cas5h